MSDQNIIPSAPPLQPTLSDDYRLKKICDCQEEIENEISHYQQVAKKYKRAKSVADTTSAVTVLTSAILSSSGLCISLSGVGVLFGGPLAGVAGLLGFIATAFTVMSKKLNKKISKHEKTISLAEAKHLSVSILTSKALNDGSISDTEFNSILREIEQYHELKKRLRSEARLRSETRTSQLMSKLFRNSS